MISYGGAGPVCVACYEHVRRHPAECAGCKAVRPLIGADEQGGPVCGPCAGAPGLDYACRECGRAGGIHSGYTVGRYVSLEQAIAESADAYYQALLDSTHGWHEGTADPWPWLGYFTGVIAGAYAVFADRAAAAQTPGTKQQRVREHILRHAPATFRLADIRTAVPGVSDQTIRLVLEQLRKEGRVRADGTGRSATWTRTNTASSE